MIGASAHQFMPDSALAFRAIGSDAVSGDFASEPMSLAKLAAYWATGEWGAAKRLRVIVGLEGTADAGVDALRFALEVDSTTAFDTPVEVASLQLGDDDVRWFELAFDTTSLAYADADAAYLRLTATGAGADVATVVTDDYIAPASGFTVNNGLAGGDEVESIVLVHTVPSGSVAFGGTAAVDDTVVIDDGTNDPVTFTYVDDEGAEYPEVHIGVSATESAQNLKTAITAAVAAGDLAVGTSGAGATITITNLAPTTGWASDTITNPVDDGGVITATAFSAGTIGSIRPQSMIELAGGTAATQRQDIADFLESDSSGSFTATVSGTTITIVNHDADPGVSSGEATENTDTGSHIAITDFDVSADVRFWAFVRND